MTELDHVIEKKKLVIAELEKRCHQLKKDNQRLQLEVVTIREFAKDVRDKAYAAVSAEATARNRSIDQIFERLKTTITLSAQQQHAIKEIMNAHKVQIISSSLPLKP